MYLLFLKNNWHVKVTYRNRVHENYIKHPERFINIEYYKIWGEIKKKQFRIQDNLMCLIKKGLILVTLHVWK